jgi:tetratricopeptide (TPR) repeat protein
MANHALTLTSLGDLYAVNGRLDDAAVQAEQALTIARTREELGHEAYALHLVGEIAAQREPLLVEKARDAYRRAIALAEATGLRPLVAHCYLGLGKLYRRTGQRQEAQEHFTVATTMYREMDMRFWLEKAEAEIREF